MAMTEMNAKNAGFHLANCTEVPSGKQFNEERQGHKHMEYDNVLSQCTPKPKKGRGGVMGQSPCGSTAHLDMWGFPLWSFLHFI